jgi:hypothetical protein
MALLIKIKLNKKTKMKKAKIAKNGKSAEKWQKGVIWDSGKTHRGD